MIVPTSGKKGLASVQSRLSTVVKKTAFAFGYRTDSSVFISCVSSITNLVPTTYRQFILHDSATAVMDEDHPSHPRDLTKDPAPSAGSIGLLYGSLVVGENIHIYPRWRRWRRIHLVLFVCLVALGRLGVWGVLSFGGLAEREQQLKGP